MASHRKKAQTAKVQNLPLVVTRENKIPKTRNVLVKLSKKQVTAVRRSCLDISHEKKIKGGIVLRVPREAKNIRFSMTGEQIEIRFKHGKKNIRRVDTPIKDFDWKSVDSRKFLTQGKRKGESLRNIRIGVRGYDSRKSYEPRVFGKYITGNFFPKIAKLRGKKNKAKKDVCNYFSVRRIYVSKHTGKTPAPRKSHQKKRQRSRR